MVGREEGIRPLEMLITLPISNRAPSTIRKGDRDEMLERRFG
jgi:hypothetical protein